MTDKAKGGLGGDEFTLILKATSRVGAKEAARTVLASLEQAFDVDSHRVSFSGSIGLTVFPDDGKDVDQLMHKADQAMYAAKEYGSQQVRVSCSTGDCDRTILRLCWRGAARKKPS